MAVVCVVDHPIDVNRQKINSKTLINRVSNYTEF
jgi:hypothetical protein